MLFCPKFKQLRLRLIRNISEIDVSIYNILHSSRFTYMMNNQNLGMQFDSKMHLNKQITSIVKMSLVNLKDKYQV